MIADTDLWWEKVRGNSPIATLRAIVQEHEALHVARHDCPCMSRVAYIMQVYYPPGIENVFFSDGVEE